MKRTLCILAGIAILTLSACQTLPRGVAKNAVMVGLADSGKLVRLVPGQQLVVQLESNPVTGFQWEINKKVDQTVLLPDGSRFSQTSAQKNQQEEVGSQYLRFKGQQPGRMILELAYVKPQVGTLPDSPRYRLEVIVAPRPEEAAGG